MLHILSLEDDSLNHVKFDTYGKCNIPDVTELTKTLIIALSCLIIQCHDIKLSHVSFISFMCCMCKGGSHVSIVLLRCCKGSRLHVSLIL